MNYYTIAGMVVIALIAVISFFASIKKSLNDERRPMEDLNINLVKLNTNFENMLKQDEIRDDRIKKHGTEIDELEDMVNDHEVRITVLEGQAK